MTRGRSASLWALILAILLLVLLGCRRTGGQQTDVAIELAVTPSPPVVGLSMVTIILSDDTGQSITGASIELEGNMSHAGMVPVFVRATETAPGRYETSLEFTMAGDWIITAKVVLPDGRTVERAIEVPGVVAP